MAWIESHQSLQKHPKTIVAANMLGISRVQLIGHLHCLWWWALDFASPKGCLGVNISAEIIAEAAEYCQNRANISTKTRQSRADIATKTARKFVDALINCGGNGKGFLEEIDGIFYLHDWWDYAGKLIEIRSLSKEQKRLGGQIRMAKLTPDARRMLAKLASKARWEDKEMPADMPAESQQMLASENHRDIPKMPAGCQQDASYGMPAICQQMPATVPNPTVPNRTQPNSTSTTTPTPSPDSSSFLDIFDLYKKEISELTPSIQGELEGAVKDYGRDLVIEAIKATARQNKDKHSWSYVAGTLKKMASEKSEKYPFLPDPPTEEAETIWRASCEKLATQINQANFETWIKPTVGVSLKNNQFWVGCPNSYVAEYLDKNQRGLIEKTISELTGRQMTLALGILPVKNP
jgi:hypothetical protein